MGKSGRPQDRKPKRRSMLAEPYESVDEMAKQFRLRIERQTRIITNLSEQHQVLMSSLTMISEGTASQGAMMKKEAEAALGRIERIQQTNFPDGASADPQLPAEGECNCMARLYINHPLGPPPHAPGCPAYIEDEEPQHG